MTTQYAKNTLGWKIKTDTGFVPFGGISEMGIKRLFNVAFTDGTSIRATSTHTFYTPDERDILVGELQAGVELLGLPCRTVEAVEYVGESPTYDIINSESSTFLANGLLSHNCKFLSNDPLLISTVVLATLTLLTETLKPVAVSGDIKFFKEPSAGSTYLVGMDVATGSGKDYTTIVAFDFPALEQVAEFRSNTMSSAQGYHTLKKLLRMFERVGAAAYFSVENNGVGEAIIALLEADENPLETAEFISEGGQARKGMTTTGRSKIQACLTLKEMVERDTIKIKSKALVAEMKQFVRSKGSYSAKTGGTDDLIMASLIAIRLLAELASYDQLAYDTLYAHAYIDETDSEDGMYDDGAVGDGMVFG